MAEPVRTRRSNIVYRGPTPDVGDAWCQQTPRVVYMTWELDEEERAAIAAGGLLRLGIYQSPIPPISLAVDPDPALSTRGAELVDQARSLLQKMAANPLRVAPGYWFVSADTWAALQAEGALDNEPGDIPTLCGRPLVADAGDSSGQMAYLTTAAPPSGEGAEA